MLAGWEISPTPALRSKINQQVLAVRREVIEAGCFHTFTIAPPPAVGGLVMNNVDAFGSLFERNYGMSLVPSIVDMLDRTIGVLRDPGYQKRMSTVPSIEPTTGVGVVSGYVFIAMPMAAAKPEYDDVLDAIKAAANACGLNAERVDEVQSNERITDRLLESIRKAEFVVADLTDARPNVFFEAGYAQGMGKLPIYVAREGTKLEFDLKDYPTIFFSNMRQLRDGLERRFRGLAAERSHGGLVKQHTVSEQE